MYIILCSKAGGPFFWNCSDPFARGLYIEAIHRMMEYPDEELDRPCLWRDFRAKVAMEVKKGRRAE